MDEIFFIDGNRQKISSETISSHIGLVLSILNNDKNMKREFEMSGKEDPVVFLIEDKGYMAGSEMGPYYKKLIYDRKMINEGQKRLLGYYKEMGYELKDLAKEKEMMEREGK